MDILSLKDRKNFKNPRRIGVEWEYNMPTVSGIAIPRWATKWKGHDTTDGSCGREAITPPVAGHKIDQCLNELHAAFKTQSVSIDTTCGTHTHVDASDLDWQGMRRLIRIYSEIEPLLYLIGGQNRISNGFTSPCGKSYKYSLEYAAQNNYSYKGAILLVAFGFSPTDYIRYKTNHATSLVYVRNGVHKKGGGRYRGLNIMPWIAGRRLNAPDCTVEFRIHRNVKDPQRIINWAKMCAAIVDYAVYSNDNDVDNLLKKSQLNILCSVAPDSKSFILKRISDWRNATRYSDEYRITRRLSLKTGKWEIKTTS